MSYTYYKDNKDRIIEKHKTKVTCECGAIVAYGNMSCHRKSFRHIIYTQMTKNQSLK
jgi:hypothetical protein